MVKRANFLSALIMAGLLTGIAGSAVAAVPEKHIFGDYKDYILNFAGKDFVILRVWDKGVEGITYPYGKFSPWEYTVGRSFLSKADSQYVSANSLVDTELDSLKLSMEYVYGLLGSAKNGVPTLHLVLVNERDSNASASSVYTAENAGSDLGEYFYGAIPLNVTDGYAGCITVHLPMEGRQFYFGYSVLPNNGLAQDYASVVAHEFFHALDIGINMTDNGFEPQKLDNITYNCHNLSGTTKYNLALHDAFGSVLSKDTPKREKVISYAEFLNTKQVPADSNEYFYGVETHTKYSGTYWMPVKADGTPDTDSNVYKILQGAKIAWPDDCQLPAVSGIPINGYEKELESAEGGAKIIKTELELSHVELQNSLMSHQIYRNWSVLMEAEIGILQDIGYAIDRGKCYGGSLYNSGVTKTALSSDFTSSQQYAIGYHVYGSNNTVDSGAAIQPTGDGAIGIRVDGSNNYLTINEDINLTGSAATGVLFSYGKNHGLTVNSPVAASGENSIGLRFDFGDNMMGNSMEYRGSYIRGGILLDNRETTGEMSPSETGWVDFEKLTALEGALMSKVDINSMVAGSKQAIYISKNAYVEKLNLNQGAAIIGDIVSEWNPTGVLYTAKEVGYTDPNATNLTLNKAILGNIDPATLMTALNFNDNVLVDGNIIGAASLDLNLAAGKTALVTGDVQVHTLNGADGLLRVGYKKNVEITDYDKSMGKIIWEEGPVEGSWTKEINKGQIATYEKPNQANTQVSQLNSAALLGWRAQNNDLNKRMGELRMKNGKIGVWARMSRGENEEGSTLRNFNLYQVGYDAEIGRGWIGGAAASLTRGNGHTTSDKGSAKAEDKSGAFALYATRLNRDNTFIDLIAKYGKTSYDVESYMTTGMGSYDFDTPTMSLSAEIGKRYQQGGFWLEPQAEFTYGLARSADYITSLGVAAHQDTFKTAVGRLGVVLGRDLPEGNIYLRGSYLHDFQGNSDLVLSKDGTIRNYNNDMGGSWWEFGIGTNLKTGKHSYIYADVEKTCGGSMRTPWRWNLGARCSF